jgi:hypothetical protein
MMGKVEFDSPLVLAETGLCFCCPEKNSRNLSYFVWRVAPETCIICMNITYKQVWDVSKSNCA